MLKINRSLWGSVPYSRQNPSPRYDELLEEYKVMHSQGDSAQGITAEKMYAGHSLVRHVKMIKRFVDQHHSKTLLDYGSGKGVLYENHYEELDDRSVNEFWDVDVRCYDPAYLPFSSLPEGKFDGVICIDVLEHIPEEDIDWVVREIFEYAHHFVYIHLPTYFANKRLPSGENPHVTVKPYEWWSDKLEKVALEYPDVYSYVLIGEKKKI